MALTHFKVVVADPAKKELKKLPKQVQKEIVEILDGLSSVPRPSGAEKLKANPVFMRVRAGNYRVIYAVRSIERLVVVCVIRDRKDAFKGIDSLDGKLARALSKVADHILERAPAPGTA